MVYLQDRWGAGDRHRDMGLHLVQEQDWSHGVQSVKMWRQRQRQRQSTWHVLTRRRRRCGFKMSSRNWVSNQNTDCHSMRQSVLDNADAGPRSSLKNKTHRYQTSLYPGLCGDGKTILPLHSYAGKHSQHLHESTPIFHPQLPSPKAGTGRTRITHEGGEDFHRLEEESWAAWRGVVISLRRSSMSRSRSSDFIVSFSFLFSSMITRTHQLSFPIGHSIYRTLAWGGVLNVGTF